MASKPSNRPTGKVATITRARVDASVASLRADKAEAEARSALARAQLESVRQWRRAAPGAAMNASASFGSAGRGSAPYTEADLSSGRKDSPPINAAGGRIARETRRSAVARAARQAYRTTTLAPLLIDSAVDFLLGDGLYPQTVLPQGRTEKARMIEDLFIEWAESAEHTRRYGWGGLQRELLRSAYLDGDVLGVLVAQGDDPMVGRTVQMVEAQLVRDGPRPQSQDLPAEGLELDSDGRVLRYRVAVFKDGAPSGVDIARVDARGAVFLANVDQISQYRGISALRGMIDRIIGADDMFSSYIRACDLTSRLAAFVSSRRPELTSKLIGAPKAAASPTSPKTTEIPAGSVHYVGEDVTVSMPQSPYPAASFDASLRMLLRVLGARMGLPLEVLLLDASQSTAYAGRTAVMMAMRQRRMMLAHFVRTVCTPIYQWRLREWAQAGVIDLSQEELAYALSPMGVRWIGLPIGQFDPEKETAALVAAINANLMSKREAAEQLGGRDFASVAAERSEEKQIERELGIEPVLMPGQAAGGEAPPA
ncbi:MAG: phage portal protein [Phycisphaerales bacterium]